MRIQSTLRGLIYVLVTTVLAAGCLPDVPATNPFDPDTPEDAQKKASLSGTIFKGQTDEEGRIISTGEALADANIELLAGPTRPENNPIKSDANGTFSFTDLIPGSYQIVVTHPEYERETRVANLEVGRVLNIEVPVQKLQAIVVNDDGTSDVNINYTLTGRAKLGNQSAVEDAAKDHSGIVVQVRTSDEEPTSIQTTTGPDGTFGFTLNPGDYKLYFSARNHISVTSDIVTVVEGELLELDEPVVLDINPGGITGVINLEGASENEHDGVTVSLAGTDKAPLTEGDGAFILDNVGAGVHRLIVTREGFDTREVAGVVVNAGEETELDEIIELKRSRGTVKGTVSLAGSMTSDGVAVQIVSADGRDSFTTLTNSDGEYRFEKVPVGQYSFTACKQGYLPPADFASRAINADEVRAISPVTMNKPIINFVAQDGQPSGRYFTNEESIRIRFSELPIDQLTGVKVTGDAQVSAGDLDDQGWVNGQVATDDTGAYLDLTLSPDDGAKLIQVQFRNDGCFVSDIYQLVITLDRTGPRLIDARVEGNGFSGSRDIVLNLIALDAHRLTVSGDVAEVDNVVLEDENITINAKQQIAIKLTEGDGPKTIGVTATDAAGNRAVAPDTINATVVLDTSAPSQASVTIEQGADYVGDARVLLNVSAMDANGVSEMLISNDATFVGAQWQPYQQSVDWLLEDASDGDTALFAANDGMKSVYVRFRDAAGNEMTVENAANDSIELDRLGALTIRVAIDGPEDTTLTNVVLLRGPEATEDKIITPLNAPDGTGQSITENVPVGTHYISAELNNFYVERFAEVVVSSKQSNPEIVRLLLKYETGTLTGTVDLAEADLCPSNTIQIKATNIITGDSPGFSPQFNNDCQFTGELPVGRYAVTIERLGFEPIVIDGVEVQSYKTYELGRRTLPRARGTISGTFNLQGRTDHSGINVTLMKAEDPTLGETAPTYTAVTVDGGRFSREGLWAGEYTVFASKDGFIRESLDRAVLVAGGERIDATQDAVEADEDGVVILQRQTGDFLINGGAEYTNDPNVTVELEFTAIKDFQYRINGGAFSQRILWSPTDETGKKMAYGIELPSIEDEADLGDRIIEIRTRNLQDIESAEPFYQASIILDQTAPIDPSIIIDDGRPYTNSSLGLVTLNLAASDLNKVSRVYFSPVDDCAVACADWLSDTCQTVAYEPILQFTAYNADTDGEKTIFACFIDPAGNVSPSASASIIRDTIVPSVNALTVEDVNESDCAGAGCFVNSNTLKFSVLEGASALPTDSTTSEIWVSIDDPTYSQGAWQPYRKTPEAQAGHFTLPLLEDDGEYTIYVRVRDQAGNVVDHTQNATLSIGVDLDTTPPTLPITNALEYFISTVDVGVVFANTTPDIAGIQWSWTQTWTETEPVQPSDTLNIPLPIPELSALPEQKLYTLYVRFWDDHQNPGPPLPVFVTYDTEPPTVSRVQLNYGNTYLDAPDGVPFEVTCADAVAPSNRLRMNIVQTNGDTPNTIVENKLYAPLVAGDVRVEDGPGRVTVTCTDQADNVSAPFNVDFTLDTVNPLTGPAGSGLQINGGDSFTAQGIVALAITGVDNLGGSGIDRVAVTNGNIDCATAAYQPWVGTAGDNSVMTIDAWALPNGEIEHTVSACVMDRAGRAVSVSDTIQLDTIRPEGDFTILGANEYQGNLFVANRHLSNGNQLRIRPSLGAQENAGHIQVGAAVGQVDCDALAYADYQVDMTVLKAVGATGQKHVTVCFRDGANNETRLLKAVTYDAAAPRIVGDPVVNLGQNNLADANDVSIDITCADDDTNPSNLAITIADQGGNLLYDGVYSARVVVNVPLESVGAQALIVQCTDAADNQSESVNVPYVLDLTPPTTAGNGSSIQIDGGQVATDQRAVTVDITAVDNVGGSGVAEMAIAEGAQDCGTAQYQPIQNSTSLTVSAGDGVKTVSACLKDRAGNAAQITDTIILDTAAPTGGITLTNGSAVANANLSYAVVRDSSDATQTAAGLGFLDCDAGATTYQNYTSNAITITLPAEGDYDLSVCLRDAAGNTTKYVERVSLDQTPPSGFFVINDGAGYTSSRDVLLKLNASGDVSEVKYKSGSINCAANANYTPVDLAMPFQLTQQDGSKPVFACIRDAAGNVTELDTQTIVLDTHAPEGVAITSDTQPANSGILIEGGASMVSSTTVTVTIKGEEGTEGGNNAFAGSGIAEFKLSVGDGCVGGAWQPWSPNAKSSMDLEMQIEAGDNVARDLSVTFRDEAGNESAACAVDSITVDTAPLEMSRFVVASDSGATQLTTSRTVTTTLDHTGNGTCATYQVSENPAFPAGVETTDLPCIPGGRLFTMTAGDAIKTIYARVVDTAGNVSAVLTADIELDTVDPTLNSANATTTQGANGRFSNDRDVQINLVAAVGGTSIRYRLYDSTVNCGGVSIDDLTETRGFSANFFVSFTSDGDKSVCVAITDDAGNASPIRRALISVDSEAPTAPTLDPGNLSAVNSSCVNITPSGAVDANFWKYQFRQAGESWQDSMTDSGEAITIPLYQDSDNIIEVRAIDDAGNTGEVAQAFIEETSSVFIPTNLQIKQICDGGRYAILKDLSIPITQFQNQYAAVAPSEVKIVKIPAVALLDLQTFAIRQLNPPISANTVTDFQCNESALFQMVLDAACSVEDGEPRMLVVSPTSAANGCITGPARPIVRNRLWVYPDPIEQPLALGSVLDENVSINRDSPLSNGVALVSIDALQWLNDDNDFRALATTAETYSAIPGFRSFSHRLRRLYHSAPNQTRVYHPIDSIGVGLNSGFQFQYASTDDDVAASSGNLNHIRGLAHTAADWGAYAKYSSGQWRVFRGEDNYRYESQAVDSATTEVDDFTAAATDPDVPIYNVLAGPAHYRHNNVNSQAHRMFTYLEDSGRVYSQYANNTSRVSIATNAPSLDGERYAPYFDSERTDANWLTSDDPRTFRYGVNYSTGQEQRYRFPVDTGKGIFPYLLGGGDGEPYVIYHTEGLSQGIVIGSKNDAACAE